MNLLGFNGGDSGSFFIQNIGVPFLTYLYFGYDRLKKVGIALEINDALDSAV